jgi:hypothetical protein
VDRTDQVDLIWYPAEANAPVLGYPSKIVQLDNVSQPWLAEGVGEVYGALRTFNHRQVIPFQQFGHVCGTEDDFTTGGTYDPFLPPVEYDRNNIPVCCNPAFVGQGGGVGSGTATVTVTPHVGTYEINGYVLTRLSVGNYNLFGVDPFFNLFCGVEPVPGLLQSWVAIVPWPTTGSGYQRYVRGSPFTADWDGFGTQNFVKAGFPSNPAAPATMAVTRV